MARRVACTMNVSVDGYVADRDGGLGWADPDPELFRFVTEETRRLSAYVMGRRLYETMLYWETVDQASLDDDAEDHGFMYSRSFFDLDGHGWQVMWMDPAAAEQGPEAFAAATEEADAAA